MKRKGFGFGFKNTFGKAHFSLIELGVHYHPKHDPEPCQFRWGIEVGLLGILLAVGIFEQ